MHGSQYVTNQFDTRIQVRGLLTNLRKMLATKFFSSLHDEDQETPWSQNPTVYKHNSFFKRKLNYGKFYLRSQFAWTQLCFTLAQPLMALKKNPYICLGLWEKKS